MQNHKTKLIKYKDMEAEVDCGIADLILNLWKLDIYTVLSCENNVPENYVWIQFMTAMDAEAFLNIAANEFSENPKSLYNRIRQAWDDDEEDNNFWQYDINIDDMNVEETYNDEFVEETSTGKPDFNVFMSVRFPKSDLETVSKNVANRLITLN